MNNISMKVNFPLATTKDPVNLQIYRYTIDQLTAMEGDAIFLNTEEDETHLNIEANEELLCLLEKDKRCQEYGHPSVKLFANNELINLPESSFGMVLKDKTVKLYINEKFYSEWTGIEPSLPPCNMSDISIAVEGKLDYYIGLTESSSIK
ncbi:MAG TPA: hypothetical protein ENL04_05065, partial [Sulfuricurvum sp.]|nr:hypothetical protein [Sulfuricurvum sp.]